MKYFKVEVSKTYTKESATVSDAISSLQKEVAIDDETKVKVSIMFEDEDDNHVSVLREETLSYKDIKKKYLNR